MLLAGLILSIFHSICRSHIRNTSPFTCEPFCLLWYFCATNPSNKSSKQSQIHNRKSKRKKWTKYGRQGKWKIMSIFRVFDMREKVIKREGARVVERHLHCNLCVCCVLISPKTKTKFFCSICSCSLILAIFYFLFCKHFPHYNTINNSNVNMET